jgi:diguanylate cyclase (GGDEF)-like protein
MIMADIDHFKDYNDHYGHQAGDDVLKQVADMLHHQAKRGGELAARYGGEEFALILPGSNIQACKKLATQIQQNLADLAIAHKTSDIAVHITASLGLVSEIPDKQSKSGDLIQAADKALYQAKAGGRNTICHAN